MTILLMAKGDPLPALLIMVVLVVIVWAFSASQRRRQSETLKRLSSRVSGTVFDAGVFSEPVMEFPVGRHVGHLEFFGGSKNRSPYTRIRVHVGRSPGILHILEQSFGQEFLKFFGTQDLEIGDPEFDRAYVIKATPRSLARSLFTPERRGEGMRIVRSLRGFYHPTFDLDAAVVTVTIRGYLRSENDLLMLIDAAKGFTAFVTEPLAPTGIVLEEVRVERGGECPVCGTTMNAGTVRCDLCRTPHHRECWQYMGRCTTYACKGTRSVA